MGFFSNWFVEFLGSSSGSYLIDFSTTSHHELREFLRRLETQLMHVYIRISTTPWNEQLCKPPFFCEGAKDGNIKAVKHMRTEVV